MLTKNSILIVYTSEIRRQHFAFFFILFVFAFQERDSNIIHICWCKTFNKHDISLFFIRKTGTGFYQPVLMSERTWKFGFIDFQESMIFRRMNDV